MKKYFSKVLVIEKEPDLLQRASLINQARIHAGYHYPRSFLTAYRSSVNFSRFLNDFDGAVVKNFNKVYALARQGSLINARRFYEMFHTMGLSIKPAPPRVQGHFNRELIDEVFSVEEAAFDAVQLKTILKERLDQAGVVVAYNTEVEKIEQTTGDRLRLSCRPSGQDWEARMVFNCVYSRTNHLSKESHLEGLPLKHELTELALVEVPEEVRELGITVMDGPFFSVMPYPASSCHSLSHVRYTPHYHWTDADRESKDPLAPGLPKPASNFPFMVRDAQRYVPSLKKTRFISSLFEVKTVLLQNEIDDGRPILFKQNHGLRNLFTIIGGKIDNIYDVLDRLEEILG